MALIENIFQPTLVAPVNSNVQASIDSKIADISKQVNDVLNTVRSLSSTKASMPAETTSSNDVASTPASVSPPSYAAIVSSNIPKVVKSAIAESIREQKAADRDKVCVSIHNMHEHGRHF